MPKTSSSFPGRSHVIEYLCNYEARYDLPVKRPLEVERVLQKENNFEVHTGSGTVYAKAVISATGTYGAPVVPDIPVK